MNKPCFLPVFFILFSGFMSHAQDSGQNLQDTYRITITRTTEEIIIDGDLSENIWQNVPIATDFWMSFPVDNQKVDSATQTEVRIVYDDTYLYIAAICKGPGPYIIQSLKRDNPLFWKGDAFGVVFDPINQRTNGFSFAVNPGGVQSESLITGQTGRRGDNGSSGINGAWDNKWYTDVRIYDDRWTCEMAIPFKTLRYADKSQWGINFMRGETKSNSYHSWSPVPVQFRSLDLGYTGALVWDQPPAETKRNISVIPYALAAGSRDFQANQPAHTDPRMGMDAKIALSSSLNLDLTLNPDFSQVDVDEQVTNLTTVNVQFPERRLFFLENSDLYSDFGIPPMRPFFSRRIGLDEQGNTIPILFGARLSGNINKNLRIGAMNMQTRESVFPGNNYTSFAIHQRVFGRTIIKGYFHNRQAYTGGEIQQQNFNRIGGLEFSYRSMDGRWQGFGGYGLSQTHQWKSHNYFYNTAVGFDGRNFSAYTNFAGVGDHYVADMGFMPRQFHYDAVRDTTLRIGFHHSYTRMSYTVYPKNHPAINQYQFGVTNILDVTASGTLIGNEINGTYELQRSNTSKINANVRFSESNLLFPFRFTSQSPLPAGHYRYSSVGFTYQTDGRKALSALTGFEYGTFYNGTRSQLSFNVKYRIQPWGNFGINFIENDLEFPEPYGASRLFLIGPKTEINFSRNLYWTTFLQYNTQLDNFNINSRLQWRYQPMSDIFLVYTDNYAVEFWGPKNRAFVMKINYWFNL